ncbi:MAG: AbrB/MazE/SpoVT family DNA-binding domain-containing protein [Bryobacterales bacterium]|nr:AbrB/MazE/SpoVT family DNA-binding domain-containing protein [Bryobacterales bacterium]
MTATARIDRAGRVLIPLKLRKELGLTEDSEVVLRVEDGQLLMQTREEAVRRARERLKRLKRPGLTVVDEFLAERRAEAKRERAELDR